MHFLTEISKPNDFCLLEEIETDRERCMGCRPMNLYWDDEEGFCAGEKNICFRIKYDIIFILITFN